MFLNAQFGAVEGAFGAVGPLASGPPAQTIPLRHAWPAAATTGRGSSRRRTPRPSSPSEPTPWQRGSLDRSWPGTCFGSPTPARRGPGLAARCPSRRPTSERRRQPPGRLPRQTSCPRDDERPMHADNLAARPGGDRDVPDAVDVDEVGQHLGGQPGHRCQEALPPGSVRHRVEQLVDRGDVTLAERLDDPFRRRRRSAKRYELERARHGGPPGVRGCCIHDAVSPHRAASVLRAHICSRCAHGGCRRRPPRVYRHGTAYGDARPAPARPGTAPRVRRRPDGARPGTARTATPRPAPPRPRSLPLNRPQLATVEGK